VYTWVAPFYHFGHNNVYLAIRPRGDILILSIG
jgi:hypothetical protein